MPATSLQKQHTVTISSIRTIDQVQTTQLDWSSAKHVLQSLAADHNGIATLFMMPHVDPI